MKLKNRIIVNILGGCEYAIDIFPYNMFMN